MFTDGNTFNLMFQVCYYLAGINIANFSSLSYDLDQHPKSKTSSTTSSQYELELAEEALRNLPEDDVFEDPDATLTERFDPPSSKRPALSSIDDLFPDDTPPAASHAASHAASPSVTLTRFFGHYDPGVAHPAKVRLQILDIIGCDNKGYIGNNFITQTSKLMTNIYRPQFVRW